MSKLIVVESKVKANIIEKYVGENYKVLPSIGHVRDLATSGEGGLGVDVKDEFKPNYKVIRGKKKTINEIKKALKDCDELILATDPDREGEAISWHLDQEIDYDGKVTRITFNEVTKDKINEALNNKRDIDMDLVHAQEARRVLDRIVGFKLSKFAKTRLGMPSAGRVQSVALKIIAEKEKTIKAFVPESWYEIELSALNEKYALNDTKGLIKLNDSKEANDIISSLPDTFNFKQTKETTKTFKRPKPLDMVAAIRRIQSKLGYSASSITSVLQKLFNLGLISYPRTDSNRISDEFVAKLSDHFSEKGFEGYKAPASSKGKQDAHESIRPTDLDFNYKMSSKIDEKERKVYEIILVETLKSVSSDAVIKTLTHSYEGNGYIIKLIDRELITAGFRQFEEFDGNRFNTIPKQIEISNKEVIEKQTKPPARYTSSSLIKYLKDIGVGRPSTYGTIVKRLIDAGYVDSNKNTLSITDDGLNLDVKLQENFNKIIKEDYTANMEASLDKISEGELTYAKYLSGFYDEFSDVYDKVMNAEQETVYDDKNCEKCDSKMVHKYGRYGPYSQCINEECKATRTHKKKLPRIVISKCDKCGNDLVLRQQKKGRRNYFAGCSNFPKCRNLRNLEPDELKDIKEKLGK